VLSNTPKRAPADDRLFLETLALSGSRDLRKHWDIDRLIVGGVVAVFAYLRRDGLHGPDLLQKLSADRARASRRTSHNVLESRDAALSIRRDGVIRLPRQAGASRSLGSS
jgi:hypothetical protein